MLPMRSLGKPCFCLLIFTSSWNDANLSSRSPGSFWATDIQARSARLCRWINLHAQPSKALKLGLWGLIKGKALSQSICVDNARWRSLIQSSHSSNFSSTTWRWLSFRPAFFLPVKTHTCSFFGPLFSMLLSGLFSRKHFSHRWMFFLGMLNFLWTGRTQCCLAYWTTWFFWLPVYWHSKDFLVEWSSLLMLDGWELSSDVPLSMLTTFSSALHLRIVVIKLSLPGPPYWPLPWLFHILPSFK